MSQEVSVIAQKGLGYLWNATVASASGISSAITKAKRQYADYQEKEQLDALRRQGRPPADLIFQVMQRFCYLNLAGYQNEAAAAARKVAMRLADYEHSSIPLDAVVKVGNVLTNFTRNYGDFSSGSWMNLSDFLNSTRMGKDHYDRDSLVSEFYYSILLLLESTGGVNDSFERGLKEAAGKLVEGSHYRADVASYTPYAPSPYNLDSLSGSLPAYAQVSPSIPSYTKAPPGKSSSSSASSGNKMDDPKSRAAKVLYVIASSIKKAADEADGRRLKSLKEAEEMLRREREPKVGGPTAGSGSSMTGFGSGSGYGSVSGYGSYRP